MYNLGLNVQNLVDTNGFAYYKLEGIDRTFQIHVATYIPDDNERWAVFDLRAWGWAGGNLVSGEVIIWSIRCMTGLDQSKPGN